MRRFVDFNKITKVSEPLITAVRLICSIRKGGRVSERAVSDEPTRFDSAHCSLLIACCYLVATSECVIACTDNAIRFCTPTLRINFATCAFTVRSSIPN